MSTPSYRNALPASHQLLWYRIERVLGQGGFGVTYLATDTKLQRLVAIKEYLPIDLAVRDAEHALHALSTDQEATYRWGLERFLQEAQTLAQFSHPHIVQVYSFFEANNTAYMVMRYEEGESLATALNAGQFNDQESLLKLLLPLLDGLEKVHAAGLIHRDIKPANIFVRQTGSPVLLDFGSARQLIGNQTRTLTSLVSVGYAPLEQYEPQGGKQGPWTDIYALGATLYLAATGHPPTDALVRGHAHLEGKPEPLKRAAEIGGRYFQPRFLQAIDKALELLPARRPQSIAEWRLLFPQAAEARPARRPWAWGVAAAASLLLAVLLADPLGWWEPRNSEPTAQLEPPTERLAADSAKPLPEQLTEPLTAVQRHDAAPKPAPAKTPPAAEEGTPTNASAELAAKPPPAPAAKPLPHAPQPPPSEAEPEALALAREPPAAASASQSRAAEPAHQREQAVNALLERAERQRRQGRLTRPSGDNAYDSYQQVLALVPAHPGAEAGLADLADDYRRLAAARRAAGELKKSLDLVRSGLRIAPDHGGLQELQAELEAELVASREPKQPAAPAKSTWEGVTLIKQHAEKLDDVVPPSQ